MTPQLALPGMFAPGDTRPHMLIVADKWEFKLDYIDVDGNPDHYLYHAVQWTVGLGAKDRTTWAKIKKQLLDSNQQLHIRELPYVASDGKTYQVEFIDHKACYDVAQAMRLTADRPQLKEIRDYLSTVGTKVDAARRRQVVIEKHLQAGLGNHPDVQRLVLRDNSISVFNALKATITKVCDEKPQWGKLIDTEYVALFGEVASALKAILSTKNIRDALPSQQLSALTYAETTLQAVLSRQGHLSNEQIETLIDKTIRPIGEHLEMVCEALGIHPITGKNLLEQGDIE